jgi:hypothetical protein
MQLDVSTLSAADVRALAETVVRLDEQLGTSRVAIVVPNPVTFGYARMYELLAEPARVQSRVFYSRSDAIAWLKSQVPAVGGPDAAPMLA